MNKKKNLSPLKAIRAKCLDCMCGSKKKVKECTCNGEESTFCALYPYRFGKKPIGSKKRVLTDEQRQKMVNDLKKARKARKASEDHT